MLNAEKAAKSAQTHEVDDDIDRLTAAKVVGLTYDVRGTAADNTDDNTFNDNDDTYDPEDDKSGEKDLSHHQTHTEEEKAVAVSEVDSAIREKEEILYKLMDSVKVT